jgi:2-dehydropantoate 2-reductase
MRVLVVGAGATGGYFGGRLAQAGRDVTFLVRAGRKAQLEETGLQIVSPHGDVTLAPQLVTADAIGHPFDLVLLTVKAFSLHAALDDVAPSIGPDTMILPVLNGMRHVETISARFGAHALLGGVARIAGQLDAQGRVLHLAPFQELMYGEMDGSASDRIARVDALMQNAVFDARSSTRIVHEMWLKWVFLASLGGITCLARGTVGEIEANGGAGIATGFVDELVAIATAVGEAPSETYVAGTKASLTTKGSSMTSSMYRDLQAGFRLEDDEILGDLLRLAQRHQIAAPLLSAARVQLGINQARGGR